MFLPSMLKKNGGKFGAALGNALMNKFQAPKKPSPQEDAQLDSPDAPEVTKEESTACDSATAPASDNNLRKAFETRPVTYNFTKEPTESRLPLNKFTSKSTDNLSNEVVNENNSTLDRIERNEILNDVRSNRVKAPSTRPKSTNIFKEQLVAANIPLDENSYSTPPDSPQPQEKKEEKKADENMFKTGSVQPLNGGFRRQTPIRNRTDRPLSVGNVEALRRLSPEGSKESKIDEVDTTINNNKVSARKALYHSKSTELLGSDFVKSKEPEPKEPSEKTTNPADKLTIRSLKNVAVTLTKSVKLMEGELVSMKAQLHNLITLIGEIENGDKK